MADQHPIVGTWSIDAMSDLSAQEDTVIVFRPDGTGWLSFEHYVPCELDTFRWTIGQDGRIQVRGVQYTDGDTTRDSDLNYVGTFTIQSEETAPGKTMTVVSFDPPLWCTEDKWARLSAEPDYFPLPRPISPRDRERFGKKPWWKFWQ